MVGREGVLVAGEDLFVEFLTRAESAVFDHDVLARFVAGELDHATGKVVDLD